MNVRQGGALILGGAIVAAAMSGVVQPTGADLPAMDSAQLNQAQKALIQLHEANVLEMELGRLAMEKGSDPRVRAYGERLFRDHRYADRRVRALAAQRNLAFASAGDSLQARSQDLERIDLLKKLGGTEFDWKFLQMMMEGHQETVGALRNVYPELSVDTETRRLVERMTPILKQHHQVAMNVQGE